MQGMAMKKVVLLAATHLAIGVFGFMAGVFALPILIAPESPSEAEVAIAMMEAEYRGSFTRDLAGSDFLHWGEGEFTVSDEAVSLKGKLAPGPDYKLYLSPVFVETEEEFAKARDSMVQVGSVNTFTNFVVPLDDDIDPGLYSSVIVWCETFGEFITAGKYR